MPHNKPIGKKLRKPQTASYRPQPVDHWGTRPRDTPLFTWMMVRYMIWDPIIRLGLAMRAAPIMNAEMAYREGEDWKTGVKCDHPGVAAFVERQFKRFWARDLRRVMAAQIWGWAAGELVWRVNELNQIEYGGLLDRNPADVRALDHGGKQIGVRFRRIPTSKTGYVDLKLGECLWHAFNAENGSHYGQSVLKGCYDPWCDKYLDGGARDVRRLFMHKDAYGGTDISYPPGVTNIDGKGVVPNQDIARQIGQQLKAGGATTRPAMYDQSGKELWTINRATIPGNPNHILQYPKDLDQEILRGLEIPDDVLTSEGMTGAWAGKAVPQQAFYTGLDGWLRDLARDFKEQACDFAVIANFGKLYEYEATFKPLAEQASEQSGDKEQSGGSAPMVNPFAPRYQMGLEQAIGEGAVNAAQLVKGVRKALGRKPTLQFSNGQPTPTTKDAPRNSRMALGASRRQEGNTNH